MELNDDPALDDFDGSRATETFTITLPTDVPRKDRALPELGTYDYSAWSHTEDNDDAERARRTALLAQVRIVDIVIVNRPEIVNFFTPAANPALDPYTPGPVHPFIAAFANVHTVRVVPDPGGTVTLAYSAETGGPEYTPTLGRPRRVVYFDPLASHIQMRHVWGDVYGDEGSALGGQVDKVVWVVRYDAAGEWASKSTGHPHVPGTVREVVVVYTAVEYQPEYPSDIEPGQAAEVTLRLEAIRDLSRRVEAKITLVGTEMIPPAALGWEDGLEAGDVQAKALKTVRDAVAFGQEPSAELSASLARISALSLDDYAASIGADEFDLETVEFKR
ncbi:uncharacterized protein LOC62_03G003892 [Vanrija pseudolonga]|uniref:Uncharacterized protein n=1 Tax=Vanrija pseudolonga TaxID=143232 RepID=A0AAF0Y4X1_9TREE|nr:hypothetical protein LOC62_03G003892 [Vanrija pseudolonga]